MLFRLIFVAACLQLAACTDNKSDASSAASTPRGGGNLAQPRCCGHTVSKLQDGRILVVGGTVATDTEGSTIATASAELINPATNQIIPTGSMLQHRRLHTATVLNDGKVLITGGTPWDGSQLALETAEIYDPVTQQFHYTHQLMAEARFGHTATLLNDGTVLILGGDGINLDQVHASAEIFNPADESFTRLYEHMNHARTNFTATMMKSGRVLIAGGINWGAIGGGRSPYTAEIFDPVTHQFQLTPTEIDGTIFQHHDALLPSGKVLLVDRDQIFLFDENTRLFTKLTAPAVAHDYAPMITLHDGSIALVSGQKWPDGSFSQLLPVIDTFTEQSGHFATRFSPVTERWWSNAIVDNDGWLWMIGGTDVKFDAIAKVEAIDAR